MVRKQPPLRSPKPVYCFIVEGCTEENYLKLLKKIYRKDAVIKNCNGDAKTVMNNAQKTIQSDPIGNYSGYVIWFDEDRFVPANDTNLKTQLATIASVKIYISQPCMERWLLAHFQSIVSQPNEACKFYEKKLEKIYIPYYEKNNCSLLDRYIDQTKVETAIKNYPELGEMPKKYFCETDDPQPQLPAAQLPQQTYLTRIDQFYSQVKDWLKQHNLTVTETKTVDVTDKTGEKYVAPVLSILKLNLSESDGMVAELLPQRTSVYTEGLIKLVGVVNAEESITYRLANGIEPAGWYWVEVSYHKAYLIDKSRFLELLYLVSGYE